ncbi:MAG: DNA recombination/repair protein RecA [Staphylococcus sp.]|nr:DNA recombination/repair protein RecA [Staphylococcus sp.]
MTNKLLDAIKLINSKFKNKDTNEVPIVLEKQEVPMVSSGSLAIDIASNAGGIPEGRIYEFFGAEASGKTTATLKIASEYIKNAKSVAYIDAEQAFSTHWASKFGLSTTTLEELVENPDKPHFVLTQTSVFEEAMFAIRAFIEAGVKLVIVDSVPMLIPQNELNEEEVEGKGMPLFAKNFRRELRKLTSIAAKNQANIIFINHMMQDISKMGYGDKSTTPGGTALKYLSSMRLKFARIKTEKDKDDKKIANRVEVSFVKNKVAAPYGKGVFTLNFEKGWDNYQELIDYAVEQGIIEKENPRSYWYEGRKIATSSSELYNFVSNNKDNYEEVKEKLLNKINSKGVDK